MQNQSFLVDLKQRDSVGTGVIFEQLVFFLALRQVFFIRRRDQIVELGGGVFLELVEWVVVSCPLNYGFNHLKTYFYVEYSKYMFFP